MTLRDAAKTIALTLVGCVMLAPIAYEAVRKVLSR